MRLWISRPLPCLLSHHTNRDWYRVFTNLSAQHIFATTCVSGFKRFRLRRPYKPFGIQMFLGTKFSQTFPHLSVSKYELSTKYEMLQTFSDSFFFGYDVPTNVYRLKVFRVRSSRKFPGLKVPGYKVFGTRWDSSLRLLTAA